MKKIALIFVLLTTVLFSCQDVLDKEPLDGMSDVAMWGGEATTQAYVNSAYVAVTYFWNHPTLYRSIPWGPFYSEGCDEGFAHLGIGGGTYIATGELSPSTSLDLSSWKRMYYYVQHINTFFDNDEAGRLVGDEATINRWRGDMHFIRAWIYSRLTDSYGGVVLSKTAYTAEDIEIDDVRASYDECVDFMIEDLDQAIALLPESLSTGEIGKATKGIAMALKARVLLHAASELHNPSHDNTKWQDASDAAIAVINSGYYSLYHPENYNDIFFDFQSEGNTETILSRHVSAADASMLFWYNFPTTMFGPVSWKGWGIGTPTQAIVDAFEMADGTPYDRAVHGQNPYENREPRFYANILFDGAEFSSTIPRIPSVADIGTKVQTGRYVYTPGDTILGYDRFGGALQEKGNATRTGYYIKKFVWEDADEIFEKDHMQVIFLRLSEMYLNYAEAQVELGNGGEAAKFLKPLRDRVGLPTPDVVTIDDVRHERRVELAFEGNRFFDVRRWKILDQTFVDQEKTELVIDYTGAEPVKKFSYVQLQERNYNPAYYYLPIPASEIEKNPNLEQNPGYN
ncbi:RagB/SusD family nutrient uptake outer membrane protein [Mangrovibacterium sp.]|uniref:RagB/SusD family nutrient uptake outer membrane protein n=1 Tax=Mangrovibacterium sp. TaxID=1961364 RepID=UPI0035676262